MYFFNCRAASAIKVDSDSDSDEEGGEKVKFEGKKGTADSKENKKNALYARFVNVSTIEIELKLVEDSMIKCE